MQIDGPSPEQTRRAAVQAAALLLAHGQPSAMARAELARHPLDPACLDGAWHDAQQTAAAIIHARRRRIRRFAFACIALGLALLAGFVVAFLVAGSHSVVMLLALLPIGYGTYLLCLPPTADAAVLHPRLFGRAR